MKTNLRLSEQVTFAEFGNPGLRSISQQIAQLLGKIAITLLNDQLRSIASKYGAIHMEYSSWNILANRICPVTLINYHPY